MLPDASLPYLRPSCIRTDLLPRWLERQLVGAFLEQSVGGSQPPRFKRELGQLVALNAFEVDDHPAKPPRGELHLEDVRALGHQGELLDDRLLQPDRSGRRPEVPKGAAIDVE